MAQEAHRVNLLTWWGCRHYHLRPEQKVVRDCTAVRCLYCGAEDATIDRYAEFSVKWRLSFRKQNERNAEDARRKIIDEAFHQDPAQAALTSWREQHIK